MVTGRPRGKPRGTAEQRKLASALKGELIVANRDDDVLQLPGICEGIYTRTGYPTKRPSGVVCPYCREAMIEGDAPVRRRVVRVLKAYSPISALTICVRVPKQLGVYGCRNCHVVFTFPRERSEQPTGTT
jgi:hypothetical protein